jgi:hypothetical protein
MASDVGSILLIVGASLIGIGAIALSATTYSIDDMLTKSNNRATYKKETVESDSEDEEINLTNDTEESYNEEDLFDLNKKLPFKGENEKYGLDEGGWSGGKKRSRKRKTNKSKTNKSKSKSRKSKSKK